VTEHLTPDRPPTLDEVLAEFAAGAPGPLAAAYEKHLDQRAAEARTLAHKAREQLQARTTAARERISANRAEFEQLATEHGVTLPLATGLVWEDPTT